MDIRKLIEEINALAEDEFIDDFENTDDIDTDVVLDDEVEDQSSATDELAAKTNISRALDTLKDALDYFQDITAAEIDLVQDADLNLQIENLSSDLEKIELSLLGQSKNELAVTEPIENEQETAEESEGEDEAEEENFDDAAELDLFNNEEE